MPSKSKKPSDPEDRWVRDILEAKISPKAKLRRMTKLAQRLENNLNASLADKNYEGGVQYWITKHDNMVLGLVRAYNAMVACHDCAEMLFESLSTPKLRPKAVALFRNLLKPDNDHCNPDHGPKRRRVSDQEPARTSPRHPKAV